MKRVAVGVLLGSFLAGMFVLAVDAQNRGRGRGRRPQQPAAPAEAPQSAEISASMGDLQWGWTKAQTIEYFRTQIREKYRPLIAKAPGAIEEDRLRAQQGDELRRLTESEICFRGRRTGWDVSFIRDEFTQNNNECMLVQNDENSQNFYFFINDRLWKWYKAFHAEVFAGQSYDQFAEAIQARFGQARSAHGELVAGAGERTWLEWQDPTTRLRAVDQTRFYGFYCLVFEEKATLAQLPTLRANQPADRNRGHALVDSVTSGEGERANPDSNPDIVDRITGKIRNRQDAPDAGARRGGAAQPQTPTKAPPTRPEDDPLRGMEL